MSSSNPPEQITLAAKLLNDKRGENIDLVARLKRLEKMFEELPTSQLGKLSLKADKLQGGKRLSPAGPVDPTMLEVDQEDIMLELEIEADELQVVELDEAPFDTEDMEALERRNEEVYLKLLEFNVRLKRLFGSNRAIFARATEAFLRLASLKSPRQGQLARLFRDYRDFKRHHPEDFARASAAGRGRFSLLLQVFRYFLRHPVSSLRLLSLARVKRLLQVLVGSQSLDSISWIDQRFPTESSVSRQPVIFPVDDVTAQSVELNFPEVKAPLVSIVIPVYNQYATTVSCLQAVLAHTDGVEYEVIVADDCSSDETRTLGDRIGNVRVVRHPENQGFLGNCNAAVRAARGDYVLLLNNDTNPQPGWLTALLGVFEQHKDAGLVGPKLLFEDGVLQEAGGIIWRDGSGWNYGRGQSPDAPEFNYVRDTDYISGACILFRKDVWDRIGGFDEQFRPAYYEDTDLAFEIRKLGLRTIYQPASEVVHFEGVSHGNDLNSGIKKQQRINQGVFRKKWRGELLAENRDLGTDVFDARERHNSGTTVLFIDHYVPFYDKDAGSRSTFLYVKSMVEMGYRVKFLGANFFPHQPYTETLQQLGVEVLYGERFARNWKLWLEENAKSIDVIYLHRPHITEDFIDEIKSLKDCPRLVYFGHDLHYLRTEREAAVTDDSKLLKVADDWKKRETRIFDQVDTVLYPSDVEVNAVQEISPGTNVAQLPLYVLDAPDVDSFDFAARKDLLFVGGFTHTPNVDAVLWFAGEVMPRILASDPDVRLHVVGSNVPEAISNLASENIVVHGFVSDGELESLYRSVRVCVVPLRYGAGVKGKVLEAIQSAVPLITTPIGAEGIPVPEQVMDIAEGAEEFANRLLGLYTDESRCLRQLAARPAYVADHFSSGVVRAAIEQHFACESEG
ncbi:glycosyltransferase [Microbulbifer sp. YPW16]|uniref:glycosyltransferase n=1 Tax=Microbulbifer sp. YPW16 TaxID=2904242 RepID=UPI001E4438EE|nr:glycosyltransferase [Microbulbifer sp. YPW16]UHQ55866.1 glycosyltransferase [Microbulbifer sp. YPW16]